MGIKTFPLYTDSVVVAGAAAVAGRFIKFDGTVPAAGDRCQGVARTAGAIGARVPVDELGVVLVEAGAAFALGASLQVDASGRAVTKAAGQQVAIAREAATAAGQLVEAYVSQF
jgi:hypothetical protein